MSSAKGIRAGRAFVELFADDSKLVRGLRRASAKLQAFGASVRDIGLKMAGTRRSRRPRRWRPSGMTQLHP